MHSIMSSGRCSVLTRPRVAARAPAPRTGLVQLCRSRRPLRAVAASFAPPTVADTKKKFIDSYSRPIPAIYNTVVQELLVQQHFIRYAVNYKYNPVYALGFVSVFDQVLDGYQNNDKDAIFNAYVRALGEDPAKYREDATKLEAAAKELGSAEGLVPNASGSDLQRALAGVAASSEAGTFNYNKFFAVGLFRLLELTGAKEPAALERLVKAVGVAPESVNKDLLMYKGILSKLSAAKEMMREFLDRERRKQAEREAGKAEKQQQAEATPQTA